MLMGYFLDDKSGSLYCKAWTTQAALTEDNHTIETAKPCDHS